MPSTTSRRLWGGMFVAIPTAIPEEPLTSRLGSLPGNTVGSLSESSKFGWKSTVSLLMSDNISSDTVDFQPNFDDSDRKSTRLNSSHAKISYAVFCLKKKKDWRVRARRLRSRC